MAGTVELEDPHDHALHLTTLQPQLARRGAGCGGRGGNGCRFRGLRPGVKVTVQDIERALKESKIGITPAVDGKIIRLPIPELSEERRKELAKSLSKMAEEARVRVRTNRRGALDETKKLKTSGGLSEDELHDLETEIQKLTDRFVKSIDDHLKHKETEIMKV